MHSNIHFTFNVLKSLVLNPKLDNFFAVSCKLFMSTSNRNSCFTWWCDYLTPACSLWEAACWRDQWESWAGGAEWWIDPWCSPKAESQGQSSACPSEGLLWHSQMAFLEKDQDTNNIEATTNKNWLTILCFISEGLKKKPKKKTTATAWNSALIIVKATQHAYIWRHSKHMIIWPSDIAKCEFVLHERNISVPIKTLVKKASNKYSLSTFD